MSSFAFFDRIYMLMVRKVAIKMLSDYSKRVVVGRPVLKVRIGFLTYTKSSIL